MFTIVEMVVVMAIMGVLIALAIPSLEKLVNGSAVNASGRMLSAQLQLARQYAISNRCRIAVVFPGSDSPSISTTDAKYPLVFKSMLFCKVGPMNGSSEYPFIEILPNTKIEQFPTGAMLTWIKNSSGAYTGVTGALSAATDFNDAMKVKDLAWPAYGGTATCKAIVFSPRGDLVDQQTRYLTVVEGEINGTDAIIRNKKNVMQYEINGFTGRVRGVTP